MSTNSHTPIATGAAASAAVVNYPLGQLDATIAANAAIAAATAAEVAAARAPYPTLDARINAASSGYVGGNIATLTNGTAAAGQKDITVDSTVGFIVGGYVAYQLVGGDLEYNVIDTITPTTVLTMTTNIGTGGIGDNVYIGLMSVNEYLAAQAIPHAGSLTLPETIEYSNTGTYNVRAFGASPAASAATNTAAIQAALDACHAAGARYVTIDSGVYAVNGTIYLYDNIEIRGPVASNASHPSCKIVFSPASAGLHLFSNADPVSDYMWGITLTNLNLRVGTGDPGDAIHLLKPGEAQIKGVTIDGFDRGIFLGGAMGCVVDNCELSNQTVASIDIASSDWASTTTRIANTFVGSGAPWGVIIRQASLHIILDHVICQSTTLGGFNIYRGCSVTCLACYTEDVPNPVDDVALIQAGVDTDGSTDPAILSVIGGHYAGYNGVHNAASIGISVDYADSVSVVGSTFTRVGKIIKSTTHTGHIEVWGVANYQTSTTPWSEIFNLGKFTGVQHNQFGASAFTAALRANFLALTSDALTTGWRLRSEYASTSSDLILYSYDGSTETQRLAIDNTGLAVFSAKVLATGGIGVGNSASATTLGSVTKKMEVFNASGVSLGFVAIYDGIS